MTIHTLVSLMIAAVAALNAASVLAQDAAKNFPDRPIRMLGNIPPIAETLPGFDYSGWLGFFVPKGTPKPIIEKLRVAMVKTVNLPEVKSALAAQATEIVIGTPEEFRKVVQDSMVKNARMVKAVGLKVE